MKIFFKPSFIRDFKKLPFDIRREVRYMCAEVFPKLGDIRDYREHHIKQMGGFKNYYRVRLGDYRIGFKKTDNGDIEFMRVKHRKDIYRYFPL